MVEGSYSSFTFDDFDNPRPIIISFTCSIIIGRSSMLIRGRLRLTPKPHDMQKGSLFIRRRKLSPLFIQSRHPNDHTNTLHLVLLLFLLGRRVTTSILVRLWIGVNHSQGRPSHTTIARTLAEMEVRGETTPSVSPVMI